MNRSLRVIDAEHWVLFRRIRLRALADAPTAFGSLHAEALPQPEEWWRDRAVTTGPTLVLLEDDRPVSMGGVFVAPEATTAMIWGMWTAPEARGRGYGGRILDDLLAWCRAHSLGVELHVTEGNDGARALYLERGFVPTGEWEPLREGSEVRCEHLRWGGSCN